MTAQDQPAAAEELVYAAAIVILSSELYPRKLEIVREYIQNASDALDSFAYIAEHVEDTTTPQIKISIQGKSLLIWDNGIGMDAKDIQKLRRIAYSEKRVGREAGYKGIGRLAGIAVANKLIISSTSYGDPRLHTFEFRAHALQEDIAAKRMTGSQEPASTVINRHTTITEYEVDPKEHGTMVELREIDDAYPEILDPAKLIDFIGDVAPVGFSPAFQYGERIAASLLEHVPDYSPKTVWLTTTTGDRIQIFKPYTSEMALAEPRFVDLPNPAQSSELLAYCWYAPKGKEMAGKWRPAGGKFVVAGNTATERKRLAGLVFKLFGFSIGDRTFPLRVLWKKDWTRSLWFTGEIHIVDKRIMPTTDRSDLIESPARRDLYASGQERIARKLNQKAQEISNNRLAWKIAEEWNRRFDALEQEIANGGIERAELKARKEELHRAIQVELRRDCKDPEARALVKSVSQRGRTLQRRLDEAKTSKEDRTDINDLARELKLTSHARKVYDIIMGAIDHYFRDDKDTYFELSARIREELKRKF